MNNQPTNRVACLQTPTAIILAGCLIALVGFGIRSSLGLFLEPMTLERGWNRETFALALAIQNLFWGLGLPIAGAIADRFGPARVLILGAVLYGLGICGMAQAESGPTLYLTAGVLTGIGIAFTAFSIALAAMARVVGAQRRSLALGLGTAAGSLGQVLFSPLGQAFIVAYGWQIALWLLAASALLIIPLACLLPNPRFRTGDHMEQTARQAIAEAVGHRGFVLLTIGFFVCGFHVAFITVHFPAYIIDLGLASHVGAYALALIGLFNILGSLLSGAAGQRYSMKMSLATIYFARAVAITAFLLAPKTALTIYAFSAAMGLLWLSTIPLTTGIVAQIFGPRYMATLFGIVFLSHQLGSFLGVWLGGRLYDTLGTYDSVWWAAIILSLAATLIHLPIDERPLPRLIAGSS
nr:MFS transporter [uncultured Halomonas sp.]